MCKLELDTLTYAELLRLQERVATAILARRVLEAQAVREELRTMAEKTGFTLKELFGVKYTTSRSLAGKGKRRNPNDASRARTGRGREPHWLSDPQRKAPLETFIA